LAVDRKFRRQHIATRLLMMAITIFKNIDIHRISLEVKSHNEAAVSFYQKFGFEIDRKVPNYYEDGSDAYVMLFSTNKISN
ncbi:MAG: GNAT family N-acetyltransferase, partial [Methanobrevibacter sp.]|nr:GNAT family N-acetyltransferase [Methanobrevibacter sp.]